MKQKIMFQRRNLHFFNRPIAAISSLIISMLFIQSFLFAQKELHSTGKQDHAGDSLNGIAIHQEIKFKVTPQRLYRTLLSSNEFSACTKKSFNNFTAMSANIDSTVGGTFSLFDGHIIGRILELVPDQRIVEAWRVVDWPAGVYSIAKFEFKAKDSGTILIFDHIGFPEGLKGHLSIGWQEHYWDALINYLQ